MEEKLQQNSLAICKYAFFANYRRTKALWKVNRELTEELSDLPWPGETPTIALLGLPVVTALQNNTRYNFVQSTESQLVVVTALQNNTRYNRL